MTRRYVGYTETAANALLDQYAQLGLNVQARGAAGDGTTDDYAAIAAVSTELGSEGRMFFPPGTYRVGTNLTIACEAIFALGATLEPDAGATVTLDKVTTAPGASIIASGALGTVSITGAVNGSGVLDVRTFGAVGDGVEVLDAAITSGTATLSSASAPFTAAMVGQDIQVVGAGAAGAALTTTILAYVSPTAVTLAANASTTVSGARAIWGTDDTAAFQRAFDAVEAAGGGTVLTPKGIYLVDPLQPKSNTTWLLDAGTTIYANPGFVDGGFPIGASDCLIELYDVENVSISGYGATFTMRTWEYTSGEFRHCFDLRGTTGVSIIGVSADNSGGDGFCLNKSTLKAYCEKTRLVDVKADGNRRQGISVISVKDCWIIRPVLVNTAGTAPEAGIDIEPDIDPSNEMDGIWVEDAVIDANDGNGVLIALFNWMENLDEDKRVDISIVRPRITSCNAGIAIVGSDLPAGISLTGAINVVDAVTADTRTFGVGVQDWPVAAAPVRIVNPSVVRPNANASASGLFGGAYVVYRESTSSLTQTIGNVAFIRPTLVDDRDVPLVTRFFFAQDGVARAASATNLEDVTIESPMQIVGPTQGPDIVFDGAGVVTDPLRLLINNASGNETVSFGSYTPLTTNESATGTITITLSSAIAANAPLRTFEVVAAQEMRIDPDVASTIRWGGATAGQYIYSNAPGSRVTLRRSSSTTWDVVALDGEWFVEGAAAYAPTNVTTDRSFDADTVVVSELADVVGTLIADLQARGVIP